MVMHSELFDIQDKTDGFPVRITPIDDWEGENDGDIALHLEAERTRITHTLAHDERAEVIVLEDDHPPIRGPLRRLSSNAIKVEDRNKISAEIRQACHESGGQHRLLERLAGQDIPHLVLRNSEDRAQGGELYYFD
jgi:hypothetical protein